MQGDEAMDDSTIEDSTKEGKTKEGERLFVLGDSISMHYGTYLERFLPATMHYDRKGNELAENTPDPYSINGGSSAQVLEYLESVQHKLSCDVLLLNCGLHDIRRSRNDHSTQTELKDYLAHIHKIYAICNTVSKKLIWLSTTPVIDKHHNARLAGSLRYNTDVILYNNAASDFFKAKQVPMIDLFQFTTHLGHEEIYFDHVHFTQDTCRLQAAFIAGYLHGY
jgi:GDSL-like Lipase/Acylhydrolase family